MEEMILRQQPVWDRSTQMKGFLVTAAGAFPEQTWRNIILEFWCVVEAFPKYMGLTLAKTTFGKTRHDFLARDWLIGNIRIESMHAGWFIDWARAHGISEEELLAHRPSPEAAALHEWLFSVAHRGSLAQAVGAINYAIEGTTGIWARMVYPTFERRYQGAPEADRGLTWLKAHAKYDDHHPVEALEIVKFSSRPDEQEEISSSILRSLELLARGLEWCHDHGG
ncbi:MAG TPA: iron-containing redox enzyme family protein [Kofleriaceae bacterium]|nr:iron-containing redox enzyme family protein [Kofleriaceae bacterium]